ncbi:NADP-dependent alcohol dehydrogenase C 1 [Collimonas pratensis]|uniref:NADP-dependent alcohol dehydrogenase C 1 n=1 Tax=Collimonas pratensis TaxID=279113 RepID=A0A127Q6N6_9BURK|nr:NADP-dependent alcohol dehydrogenase C 1 [Collimonas pratensis]
MNYSKAYAVAAAHSPLAPFTIQRRLPADEDVAISIKYRGICHSDVSMARNAWGFSMFPMVPGHEITGIVTAVGAKVQKFKIGDRVGVGCFVDSCTSCATRNVDLEHLMPGLVQTYNSLEADGRSLTYGGYSESIVVKEGYVLAIPDRLPLDAAAPLLCAGITMYSPLRRCAASRPVRASMSPLSAWAASAMSGSRLPAPWAPR